MTIKSGAAAAVAAVELQQAVAVEITAMSDDNLAVETLADEATFEPNGNFIEVGAGSTVSYANEMCGHNSPKNNKSVDEIRQAFENTRVEFRRAIADGFGHYLTLSPK